MKACTIKTVGAALGAATLLSGTMSVAFAAEQPTAAGHNGEATAVSNAAVAQASFEAAQVNVKTVAGQFAFDQDAVSTTGSISSVFCKAAASLCASLPQYGTQHASQLIAISGNGTTFTATVNDLAAEGDAQAYTLACACATNVAGGGAVANANVSGVSLATIANLACGK